MRARSLAAVAVVLVGCGGSPSTGVMDDGGPDGDSASVRHDTGTRDARGGHDGAGGDAHHGHDATGTDGPVTDAAKTDASHTDGGGSVDGGHTDGSMTTDAQSSKDSSSDAELDGASDASHADAGHAPDAGHATDAHHDAEHDAEDAAPDTAPTCTNDPACTTPGSVCVVGTNKLETCSVGTGGCLVGSESACRTTVDNAVPSCSGTACSFTCVNGFHACGTGAAAACDDNTSLSSCGSSCTACSSPGNGTATCDGTSCGFTCNAPYVQDGAGCTPPASRPISPLTGNAVSMRKPTLTWLLPPGFTGAQVDVCADRACGNVLWTSPTVPGTSAAPSSVSVGLTLPTAITFWRVVTMDGAARSTLLGPTWEFQSAGAHGAPVMTSWPNFTDLNGDGFGDIVFALNGIVSNVNGSASGILTTGGGTSETLCDSATPTVTVGDVNGDGFSDIVATCGPSYIFLGSLSGFPAQPSITSSFNPDPANPGTVLTLMGDVNGDGYADGVLQSNTVGSHAEDLTLVLGGATGLSLGEAPFVGAYPENIASTTVSPIGDVNNDGYADMLFGDVGTGSGVAYLYLGGPTGFATTPAVTFTPPLGFGRGFGGDVVVNGGGVASSDVNGDGYLDLLISGTCTGNYPCSMNSVADEIFVYLGTGTSALFSTTPSSGIGYSGGILYYFAGGGDVNGDGYGDVVVSGVWGPSSFPGAGCTQATVPTCAGTLVYRGSASGLATSPTDILFADAIPPASTGSSTGRAIAEIGDVNGDGYGDLAGSYVDPDLPMMSTTDHPVIYQGTTGPLSETPATVLSNVGVDSVAPMY
jgi:hypothetical protein